MQNLIVYVIEKWNDRAECFEVYEVTSDKSFAEIFENNPDYNVNMWEL